MKRALTLPALLSLPGATALAQDAAFKPYEQLPGVILSLALVVALIVLAAWALRRSPLGAFARANGPLKVVATLPLGPKERLVLVETSGMRLLLGVAPAGIFRLDEPARASRSVTAGAPAPGDLRELLQERG
jgi:flagellar protein FliO/FliZ